MRIRAKSLSGALLLGALLLGGVGLALHAADDATKPETPAKPAATTPRDVLDPLLEKSEWQAKWVEDIQAYQIAFKGPDVYVRVTGDFVMVQSYLGRVPKTVVTSDLIRVLRKNYDLYQGKFGLDKDMDLWFDLATSKRIIDGEELNRQIAFVAAAAEDAANLVKTETPPPPKP
ncbi:MAG: hypothetical protein FJX75_15105 [Armatimonadetes bacterium]|nr:hypothetical protein [Armatimonadota bacterium]